MSKKSDDYENIRKCRLLKQEGYSDEELKTMGYDENTLSRTIVATNGPSNKSKTKRCKECGAKCYYLDLGGGCYECALKSKIKREGKAIDNVFASDGWKQCQQTIDHPVIIKSKN